jgi:hypothetical protein
MKFGFFQITHAFAFYFRCKVSLRESFFGIVLTRELCKHDNSLKTMLQWGIVV